ncbi:ABC transporter substrate-binding protein [Herbiconiux ginsengi]|uniref:NitT/TauT family transport system substrate-binding protein n=1 Tax=Herbiconiux ginsengi TaxID=381665 RepID=A0A1H3MWI0_9MICO|nr:ABC transporter substrate-binding protein [Herbiconiux ginsengi]SDY80848.1 NitT/TauT family transport system substrate-binding protein [Herbiconiux ginsengi]
MSRTTKALALTASVGLLAGLAACSSGSSGSEASSAAPADADHITIQLDYQPRGLHAPLFVADEKGFFADEGIVVDDILTGAGSGDTLRLVGQGQGDFGVADLPTLVVARSQGVPVKALAATNQTSPLAMCAKADKFTLDTPDDLKGLSVGVQASGSTYVFYKALLAANGIDASALTELSVSPPYESYLVTDQVDTVPCYTDAEVPILQEAAGDLSILLGSDWGYDTYGTGIFTSDEMIEKNPDLVQRFIDAYLKGLQYTIDNPEEAAGILAASDPQLAGNEELYTEQIQADIDNTFTSADTEADGLGTMNDETWQKTIDLLFEQKVIESEPTVTDVQDPQFVAADTTD